MLPLNQIRGSSIPAEIVRKAQQLVGADNVAPALSLIRYPPHLKPIMEFVFGGMFVCSNLDVARKVAFQPGIERRTVTYEGDVFDPQVSFIIFSLIIFPIRRMPLTCRGVYPRWV